MIIAKWGNSLAIRLPVSLIKTLDLKEGDEIELQPAGTGQFMVNKMGQKPSLATRFASLHQLLSELQEDEALPSLPRTNRVNSFADSLDADHAM